MRTRLSVAAKKLGKKAKATKKKAAALAKQPLGTAVVAITNPANGKADVLRIPLAR